MFYVFNYIHLYLNIHFFIYNPITLKPIYFFELTLYLLFILNYYYLINNKIFISCDIVLNIKLLTK